MSIFLLLPSIYLRLASVDTFNLIEIIIRLIYIYSVDSWVRNIIKISSVGYTNSIGFVGRGYNLVEIIISLNFANRYSVLIYLYSVDS